MRSAEQDSDVRPRPGDDPQQVAKLLGYLSLGLGLVETLAPGSLARLIGIRDNEENLKVLRAFGLRELATGAGILTQPDSAKWLWGRAAGDALDLAALASAFGSEHNDRARLTTAAAAVAGVAYLDVQTARRMSANGATGQRSQSKEDGSVHVVESVTVRRAPEEVYRFWRDFTNLPRFMEHLESVQVTDERRSHWKAKAPAGTTVEWDAEITEDRPGELIAWRSVQHADISNRGSVRFTAAPAGRGTEVRVDLTYDPPGGKLGAVVAKLFGEEPGQQIKGDLHRFRQVIEVGEVVHSDASIHRGRHPAQPSASRHDVATQGAGR